MPPARRWQSLPPGARTRQVPPTCEDDVSVEITLIGEVDERLARTPRIDVEKIRIETPAGGATERP